MNDCVGEMGPDGRWDTSSCTCPDCQSIDHSRIHEAYIDGYMTEEEAESAHELIRSQAWV